MKSIENHEKDFDYSLLRICVSCGNNFSGKYCNRCGEEVMERKEKSVAFSFNHFIFSLISSENRLIRTFTLIFFHPGRYSLKYIHGVRVPFMRPIAVFLFMNLLYFIFPVFETFDAPLRTQMHFLPHNKIATEMVDDMMTENNESLADFTIRYEQQSHSLSKFLLVIYAILAAAAMAIINYTNRYYFADHLVISFEFNSFLIALTQLILPWLFYLINIIAPSEFLLSETFFRVILVIFCVLLFHLFERRVYGQDKYTAWVKSILILPGLFIALQLYRIILFFITMLTL